MTTLQTTTPTALEHLRDDQIKELLDAHGWTLRAFEHHNATLFIGLCKVYYMDGQWRTTSRGKTLVYIGSSLEMAIRHAIGADSH